MEGEKFENKPTDMELALFWITHINNPCEDQHGNNVRDVYIREAKKVLDIITNPGAKKMLEDVIREYQP